MKTKKFTIIISLLLAVMFTLNATGCTETVTTTSAAGSTKTTSDAASVSTGTAIYTSDDLFSNRDLKQSADLTDAQYITVESGKDITISSAGVYVISGSAKETTVIVDAEDGHIGLLPVIGRLCQGCRCQPHSHDDSHYPATAVGTRHTVCYAHFEQR